MKRRLLLQGLLLSPWSRAVAVAQVLAGCRSMSTGRLGERTPTKRTPLSAVELDSLLALGEVVVEGRALSSAERGYLIEHIEDSARADRARLSLYRTTAGLLDRLAATRFADLSLGERIALVARHRLGGREAPEHEPDEARAVRTTVVPDLVDGYWSSPAGWAAVGYGTFPGRCGDLDRYTRPEA